MEKLEVGQVWLAGKRTRKRIDDIGSYYGNTWVTINTHDNWPEVTFQKWIARTGAKLEVRE